jgi:hypothetical protein
MQVTRKDVQDYWANYCERHQLGGEIVAEGLRQISLHHDYWADHTIQELREVVIKLLGKH